MTATRSANNLDQIVPDFIHIPLDIHTLILDILSPSDIIRLRKTCKTMLEATSLRVVWLKALERMCNENTIFPRTFPSNEMSLIELEYAAMAPKKWEFLAMGHQEDEIPSFATHTLNPGARRTHHHPERLYLIPGGRFLILIQRGYLSLWDLGYISAIGSFRHTKMKPIARISSACTSYAVHPSPDRSALRIICITSNSGYTARPTKYDYEVMEIFPWKSSPEFTTIATLSVASDHSLDFTSICGDRLTLVYGPILKIWDFKNDEWATLNTSDSQRQIIMTNKHIALIGKRSISIWDFPKLSKNAQNQATKPEPTTPLAPHRILIYDQNSSPDEDFSCSGLCDWYTDSPQPLWFDLVDEVPAHEEEEAECLKLSRFEADISNSLSPEKSLNSLASFNLPASEDLYLGAYRVCGDNIVIPWSDSSGIYCHLGGSSPSTNARDHNTMLCRVGGVTPHQLSFCPVSGRLAYISPGSGIIEIVDFLPPLECFYDKTWTTRVESIEALQQA